MRRPAERSGIVDKARLIRTITDALRDALAANTKAARAAEAAATDPDSRAENKYDTRNLEASYLARGQAFRVAELTEAVSAFATLIPKEFGPGQPAGEGALVTVRGADGTLCYLIGPAGGGTEVTCAGREIIVITPSSPLGASLMKRRAGDRFELRPGRPATAVAIESVE